MMFSKSQDDVCMIMKFLSNSPVTHVAANTHPAVPVPAVTSISCNHNYAINKWNNNYIRKSKLACQAVIQIVNTMMKRCFESYLPSSSGAMALVRPLVYKACALMER